MVTKPHTVRTFSLLLFFTYHIFYHNSKLLIKFFTINNGMRPQHPKGLIQCAEASVDILSALTSFINMVISGRCPPTVIPYFFGGRLIALNKKDGGVRPITVKHDSAYSGWIHCSFQWGTNSSWFPFFSFTHLQPKPRCKPSHMRYRSTPFDARMCVLGVSLEMFLFWGS